MTVEEGTTPSWITGPKQPATEGPPGPNVVGKFFVWDPVQGIWYAPEMPMQWYGGYNKYYDKVFDTGRLLTLDGNYIDNMRFKAEFQYLRKDGTLTNWMVEGWKGDYANMGVGGEIGLYYNDAVAGGHYFSADESDWKDMEFSLYKAGSNGARGDWLFTRSRINTFWITGFEPNVPSKPKADGLMMDGYIYFGDVNFAQAFINAVKKSQDPTERLLATEIGGPYANGSIHIKNWKGTRSK